MVLVVEERVKKGERERERERDVTHHKRALWFFSRRGWVGGWCGSVALGEALLGHDECAISLRFFYSKWPPFVTLYMGDRQPQFVVGWYYNLSPHLACDQL